MNKIWLGSKQLHKLAESNVAAHQAHIAPHGSCTCGAPMTCSALSARKMAALEAQILQLEQELKVMAESVKNPCP